MRYQYKASAPLVAGFIEQNKETMRVLQILKRYKQKPNAAVVSLNGLKEENEAVYRMLIDRLLKEMNEH